MFDIKIRLKAFNTITWGNAPSIYKQNAYHTEGVRHSYTPRIVSGFQPETSYNRFTWGIAPSSDITDLQSELLPLIR